MRFPLFIVNAQQITGITFLENRLGVVRVELLQAFFQEGVLVVFDKRGASPEAFLMATGRAQGDRADAVVDQFFHQLAAGHAWITDREIEAVGDGLVQVVIVDDIETIIGEDLLQLRGAPAIFLNLGNEIERPVGRGLEHRRQGVLRGVARTRGKGVEDAVNIDRPESASAVALGQAGISAMVELVGDGRDADALSGVAERF